ncbi:MAG: Fe-S cluster assembly protein SufD [Candidatus Thiodiazotropha sp.]
MNLGSYRETLQRSIDGLPQAQGDWLIPQRQAALEQIMKLGFPNTRQEAWRYTSVEGLLQKGYFPKADAQTSPADVAINGLLEEPMAARMVFVDGIYHAGLSMPNQQPGLNLLSLRSAMAAADQSVLGSVGNLSGMGDHAFAASNMATLQDGVVIQLSPGVVIEQPIELLHISTGKGNGQAQQIRHLIELEADASLNLIERYLSTTDENDYFNNIVWEISLAQGASLSHQRVQQESTQAYHLCDLHVDIRGGARYVGVNAALGGAWSRTHLHNRFSGEEAECELDGLYLTGDGQLADFHLDVDHRVPRCRSHENFKGILYGTGRAVFDGLIQVRAEAQKSQADLHNANLMLSRRAEVDTKPQLVILADDVQCSHGTTVGQLDQQALFYLRSRGIDAEHARRMLCLGFASEIIDKFESQSLRQEIGNDIARRMRV